MVHVFQMSNLSCMKHLRLKFYSKVKKKTIIYPMENTCLTLITTLKGCNE